MVDRVRRSVALNDLRHRLGALSFQRHRLLEKPPWREEAHWVY